MTKCQHTRNGLLTEDFVLRISISMRILENIQKSIQCGFLTSLTALFSYTIRQISERFAIFLIALLSGALFINLYKFFLCFVAAICLSRFSVVLYVAG